MSTTNTTNQTINAENHLFPVFLKMDQLRVLIVGGGIIGLEKVSAILNNSPKTQITLVALTIKPEIVDLQKKFSNLTIEHKAFALSDLDEKDFMH